MFVYEAPCAPLACDVRISTESRRSGAYPRRTELRLHCSRPFRHPRVEECTRRLAHRPCLAMMEAALSHASVGCLVPSTDGERISTGECDTTGTSRPTHRHGRSQDDRLPAKLTRHPRGIGPVV